MFTFMRHTVVTVPFFLLLPCPQSHNVVKHTRISLVKLWQFWQKCTQKVFFPSHSTLSLSNKSTRISHPAFDDIQIDSLNFSDLSPPSSHPELRQHCVFLHGRRKIQPHWLCPGSRAGAGPGVVTSFPRKSGRWPTSTQMSLMEHS